MKKTALSLIIACAGAMPLVANAQTTEVVVSEFDAESVSVPCDTRYYTTAKDNWFIQVGAGINSPFVENKLPNGDQKHHIAVAYNFAFGKWFSPYVGWRLSFLGGPMHWDNDTYSKAKYVSGNLDFMWDMFNSLGGVNDRRVFSIVPFVGLGGAFTWDYSHPGNILDKHGRTKDNSWTLPVSAGLQLRFRLCKYVDFFAEGRAQFCGDNFNNYAYGSPVDVSISAVGGFTFYIGGSDFKTYNPCEYLSYISNLNSQVNDLRGALATTAAALAAAEAQLPCPEVTAPEAQVAATPLMATVRFTINSAVVTPEEKVNVYNVAQWMKQNPTQKVAIIGYADKDTGSADYNMALSRRRAQAVYDIMVNEYGITPDRLTTDAQGSSTQPYAENNWNRIVIFNQK